MKQSLNFDGNRNGLVGYVDIRTGSSINTNVTGAMQETDKNTPKVVSGGTGGNN